MITGDMNTERYGYINTQGQWVVPPKLLFAKDFQEGVAAVGLATDTGFTDIHGNQIVAAPDPNGDNGEGVMEGYYLDTSGQIVLAPIIYQSGKFAGCEVIGRGSFVKSCIDEEWKVGFIDQSGQVQYFQLPKEYAGLLVRYNWNENVPFCREISNPFREGLLKISYRRKMLESDDINPYLNP
jgi:WG containing repeat